MEMLFVLLVWVHSLYQNGRYIMVAKYVYKNCNQCSSYRKGSLNFIM
ncbi:Protein of unknown function [Gryllus bimaculatus]|nr:Protein of unknown function [Gryllus bimaculatus]